jgi:hypothetical protein
MSKLQACLPNQAHAEMTNLVIGRFRYNIGTCCAINISIVLALELWSKGLMRCVGCASTSIVSNYTRVCGGILWLLVNKIMHVTLEWILLDQRAEGTWFKMQGTIYAMVVWRRTVDCT